MPDKPTKVPTWEEFVKTEEATKFFFMFYEKKHNIGLTFYEKTVEDIQTRREWDYYSQTSWLPKVKEYSYASLMFFLFILERFLPQTPRSGYHYVKKRMTSDSRLA